MRRAKLFLCAAFAAAALVGTVLLTAPMRSVGAPPAVVVKWQYHDGHWSCWDESDHSWYYTDGSHWFCDDHNAWKVYRFDRHFGKEGFVHGEYKVPREVEKIVVPRHEHPR